MVTRSKAGIHKPKILYNLHVTTTPIEPQNYTEASKLPTWRAAMSEEFQALQNQGTWSLVPRPSNNPVIGCKWVFRLKKNADGSIARHKARLVAKGHLVAKGYHQTEGVDYHETFSPVVKQPTIRIMLSLALHYQWPIQQLDVANAFLHGFLHEDVFMEQPQGFQDPAYPSHVCKLRKALYGLKQAPRAWYDLFSQFLISNHFSNSVADSSLFILNEAGHTVILLVYVDDILITGSSPSLIAALIQKMATAFAIKDLGPLSYFLGIEVTRTSSGLFLSQTKYTTELLHRAGMADCKPYASPTSSKQPTTLVDPFFEDPTLYRSLVGGLQYLTVSRPDLSFAVNSACQHMHAPHQSHFTAVKRILRYVKGTLSHGLSFHNGPLSLTAFSDADWAGDRRDRRSTTGFCLFLGPNLISWSSKKQPTVARSSTEAEYRSLTYTAADLSWVRMLLQDLRVSLPSPPLLWCDNISAISLASNPVFHARTKHIEVDYHFIREKVLNKELQIHHISTLDQVADIFTKSLPSHRFQYLQSKLMVSTVPINLQEDVSISSNIT
uniref:Reverse transcriptase Ty1/copia-type domain-containing protein n=1 Tax=Davidia involucrata TaxID=16924 RepID=A0A5B6Z4V3_DAVIN